MNLKPRVCLEIEGDLVAAATGDAEPGAVRRVEHHIDACASCRGEFRRYREIDGVVGVLRRAPAAAESVARAREGLESRLADLRSRLVSYRVFPSPLGHILIARSEHGVSLVEYLGEHTDLGASRLRRVTGVEPQEDGTEIEALYRELLEYLRGDRIRLDWTLDLRLARSDFHRIVVPCHRIIGTSGALTGYAGNQIGLKQRLLAVEGIRAVGTRDDSRVARDTLYHYDRNDLHEYCLPTCGDIARRPIGPVTLLASRELAGALGLVPCTSCRPDLHPLSA